jgi:hypothetical protein
MTEIEPTQTAAPTTHWPSVLQLGLSLFGLLSLWGIALASWQTGVIQFFNPGIDIGLPIASTSNSLGIFMLGVLLLPSAGFALLRLTGRSADILRFTEKANNFIRPGSLILLIPIILLVGYWAANQGTWALALLPPLLVVGAGLPVLWLLWLGKRKLPAGSPQRQWGLFTAALTIGPFIIVVFEIFVMLIIVVVAVFIMASSFRDLGQLLPADPNSLSTNPELIEQLAARLIVQPGVIAVIVAFLSVLVPLIEELFKPIGVWLLARRKLTPVEGFTAGLISGATFALFETLTRAPAPDSWTLFVIVRIGTAGMHIFTTGLMGWAIASAFTEKRYFRLIAAYLLAVIIHGLWNAAPVLFGVSILNYILDIGMSIPSHYIITAPIFLLYLTLAAFSFLVYSNRRFVTAQAKPLAALEELAE